MSFLLFLFYLFQKHKGVLGGARNPSKTKGKENRSHNAGKYGIYLSFNSVGGNAYVATQK